jgi:hypothetical protein
MTLTSTTGQVIDPDMINHPVHYNMHPSGLEVCEVTDYLDFNLGSLFKYVVRHDLKSGHHDVKKAVWYAEREVKNEFFKTFDPESARGLELEIVLSKFIDAEPDQHVHEVLDALYALLFGPGLPGDLVVACISLEIERREI